MFYSKVIKLLKDEGLLKELIYKGNYYYELPIELKQSEFTALSYDSRQVKKDTLFIRKGIHFNEKYLISAIDKGCSAFITVSAIPTVVTQDVLQIVVHDEQKAMATVAREFYGNPQDSLKIIGITGTKGKTTTTYFTRNLLQTVLKGKVGQFSSIDNLLDGVNFEQSHLTTPESLDLYQMMRTMVDNGLEYLVMEVSSQAYKKMRVYGLTFDTAIFLNISPDHISQVEHPDFDDYLNCKSQIIENTKRLILDTGVPYSRMLQEKAAYFGVEVVTYGQDDSASDYEYHAKNHGYFEIKTNKDKVGNLNGNLQVKIPGHFNYANATAAVLAALSVVKIPLDALSQSLIKTVVPGRMEIFENNGVVVCVDYAHNYLSLTESFKFLKHDYHGRLIVVIGAAGGKAQSRRRDIGRSLSEYADVAVLTSEDNFDEDPKNIFKDIKKYISNKQLEVFVEVDRELAIKQAIKLARPDDVVFLAAKGREKFMHEGGQDIPYTGDDVLAQKYLEGREG
ncbi:UDP-N-acetylmuramyl-tripeptide synthetase [Ligilactobacillus equi]|uniref:UDP-N-acetylmuramyl-tripeptide synthetase n=1 Tax=Ligilactobacillus equi TaxID=137357 RepID=UPI002ED5B869